MVYNPNDHFIDKEEGFARHANTGGIVGVEQAKPNSVLDAEYPKWVKVHASHIQRKQAEGAPDAVSTPGFEQFHIVRGSGDVMVLVHDEDGEKRALSDHVESDEEEIKSENVRAEDDTLKPVGD